MKKIYSLLLTAAALLVGTNAWAKVIKVAQVEGEGIDYTSLVTAFSAAESGDVIQLQSQMTLSSYIWIGEADQAATSGTGKVLTLDLNGEQLSYTGTTPFLRLTHGTLTIKTSQAGGKIYSNTGTSTKAESVILVTGSTLKDCKPKTQTNYYSHLVIENGVEIEGQKNGIVVDGTHAFDGVEATNPLNYTTCVYQTSNEQCIANGVRVDIYGKINAYKYGLKVNGLVTKPTTDGVTLKSVRTTGKWSSKVPAGYTIAATDIDYIPYIFIANGAELKANETANESTGLYCAGYADYLVQGYVHGSTGVYIKSGNVEIAEGSKIESDNDNDTGIKVTGMGSGLDAGGNAVSVESNTSYAGDINVTISGGSITAGDHGQSVQNTNANGAGAVEAVVISGGTFTGGAAGGITLDPNSTPTNVELVGGTFTGNIESLIEAVGESNVITQVVSVDPLTNEATVVVGPKEAGDEIVDLDDDEKQKDFAFVNDMANDIVNLNADALTGNLSKTLPTGTTEVKYLSLTGEDNYTVTVIVEDGKILKVGQVVMNGNGRIIVKAGGQLIITGNNGLFANAIENIVLETQEGKPAIFLFNPNVSNNRNPKATVQFTSKSCYRKPAKENIWQRFGIPMMKDGLVSIECEGNHETRFYSFNYAQNKWEGIGYINPSAGYEDQPLDYSKLNDPFEYYQLLDFVATTPDGVVYTMKGSLLGNSEPNMQILANSWKGFANSYMGKMKLTELLALIPNTVDKAVYTYDVNAKFASWEPVTNLNADANKFIDPMQPFLIRNRHDAANVVLDYTETVYKPALGIDQSEAPRRAAANNFTMAKITIANENSADHVIVAEDAQFSAEFDNGYDASKYMNEDVNLYVEAEENMSIFATNRLENTTLGVSSVLGGTYTITFSNVKGDNFVLVDNLTGTQVTMVEGNTYEFEIAANVTNSHRFSIAPAAKMPTAIENTEVKANVKGVYTLMGQYVGEKIDELPSGVYVVNGVKIVK